MKTFSRRVVVGLALCAALARGGEVFALNPRLDVSQYVHAVWRVSDGFPAARIAVIAQTTDGYLWLGTDTGLFRFDGVKATLFRPPLNQPLPSSRITELMAARDGSLWIGTDRGIAS